MGCAELRGDLEIPAHAHRQDGKAVSRGDFRKKRKMGGRRLACRRNAHHPLDRETILAALRDEAVGLFGRNAGLLRLGAGVDLNEGVERPSLFLAFISKRRGDLRPVDGFDDIKKRRGVGRLVGLKRPDQAQLDIGKIATQRRPFRLRLLDAVFAKNALAGGQRLADFFSALGFRDSNDLDTAAAACFGQRGGEPRFDGVEIGSEITGWRMRVGHEGLRTRAAKLAAAASALKRASGCDDAPFSLAFLTDRRRIAKPESVIRALPAGAAVIYRDYDDPRRAAIAARYAALCRGRGVLFLAGGDIGLARAVGADGVHYPSRMIAGIAPAPDLIVTAACHSAADLALAHRQHTDAAFLSPVFSTQSHPGSQPLGVALFKALACDASLPVLALGGVGIANSSALAGENVAGFGAIGAFEG